MDTTPGRHADINSTHETTSAGAGEELGMKIAVVGSGIAGLGAAYLLSRRHDVSLFERGTRLGGHTNTVTIDVDGRKLALDTGFIVHNEPNYPHLIRLFEELGIKTQRSEMSFSVSCAGCGLEYSGRRPFAQPSNLLQPRFYRLLYDIAGFLRTAGASLEQGELDNRTLDEYVSAHRYSRSFRNHFLIPLTAALWSTAPNVTGAFPIAHAVRFFKHHGMLGLKRFEWRTVTGGSNVYVNEIVAELGQSIRVCTPVWSVARNATDTTLRFADGTEELFDATVLAVHADEALALLEQPTTPEREVLGALHFARNTTVLHHDERLLPRRRAARASWNYQLADCEPTQTEPTMTYYLNRLQQLDESRHYCVTLNPSSELDASTILTTVDYDHPMYTLNGLASHTKLDEIQGKQRTYFCGAWTGFGFHEDGLRSAVEIANSLGVSW